MSGHSKWSKVKHQKETLDASKGKLFTKLANAITIAVKQSGGIADPGSNFKLRLIIDKAKSLNMPKDNIERAIQRAAGKGEGIDLQEVVYEAFGPGGVGIIIEATTDNKQRTVSEIKNILERGGGGLAASGSVSHLFKLVGLINITRENHPFDKIMEAAINSGAIDIEDTDKIVEVYTLPADLHKIKEALKGAGFSVASFELFYRPTTTIPVNSPATAKQILKLLADLEELEDVKSVFANFDIPDEYLQ